MYCIKRDKCYSNDNTICPIMAYYNNTMTTFVPCTMANSNLVQGGCYPCQSFSVNAMPFNYSGMQMNPMYNPSYYNNVIGNMGTSMVPVPIEEIED